MTLHSWALILAALLLPFAWGWICDWVLHWLWPPRRGDDACGESPVVERTLDYQI